MRTRAMILVFALASVPVAASARGFDMHNDVPSGSFNGHNGAGAYDKNTGNAATYNKNTGTATTYNHNTNTTTQYHTNTNNSTYHSNGSTYNGSNGSGYNGANSAGAYNKNTGNAAVYNKNTGTTTTYNHNTNTTTQYHNNYSNYPNYHYNGTNYYVTNPHGYSTWGWHGGVVWAPAPTYWGGGFWGAFAAGAIVAGATTAAIMAASAPSYPTTYVVAQSSPGYTLLTSYGLRQVPCGPNVVVINYSGSVICAAPNATVAPGDYSVNIGTLTLVSN